MTAIFFDTLAYANKLKHAGFTTKQAECQAELTAELFEHNIAAKEDINRLERNMRKLKKDIIISIGSMIMAAVAVTLIILKLIHL